jgi:hypothetical protein
MKNVLSIAAVSLALTGFATLANAQVYNNVTNDAGVNPIIGLAISPAAVSSGVDELGNAVPPSPAQYGYTTNGYVNGGMLRGNTGNIYTAITDGNLSTYGDTEYDGFDRSDTDGTAPMGYPFGSAYVGVTGLSSITSEIPVTTIKLNFALDLYGQPGSYFGDNGTQDVYVNPGATDATLHLPSTLTLQMQVTTDGTTWTSVPFVSNYYKVMNGLDVGTGTNEQVSPTVTFVLANAGDGVGIDGIRLVGTVGGGRDDGMLGVAEMQVVQTPEPSTYALMLGGLAFLAFCVRRKNSAVK